MLNLNTPNKQWNMYLNTLSSISGDDLTIKPDTRRNLLLEVSGNNNIFIKKGDVSYNLTNLITGDSSFSNVDVSVNLNPLTNNNGSLGSFNKLWNNAYIRDISATNISISGNMTISGTISNVIQIIPRLANDISTSLGTNTNIWQQAFIRDLSSISTINGSTWPLRGPTGATGLTGPTGPTGPAGPAGTTSTATWNDISNLTLTTYHKIYQEIYGGFLNITSTAVSNIQALSYSNDGSTYVVSTTTGNVSVYKIATNDSNAILGTNGSFTSGLAYNTDNFGYSVAISSDGTTIAIGARVANAGVGSNAGNVVVYKFNGTSWALLGTNQSTLLRGRIGGAVFGETVNLSQTGTILCVCSMGVQEINVYQYDNGSNLWSQLGNIITGGGDGQGGRSVALSVDGLTVAMSGTDFNLSRGRVRIFRLNYGTYIWDLIGTITGTIAGNSWNNGERVGASISFSSDGNIIAIGAHGPETPYVVSPYSVSNQGSVKVYKYSTTTSTWIQYGQTLYGVFANDGGTAGDTSRGFVSIDNSGTVLSIVFGNSLRVYNFFDNFWNSRAVIIQGSLALARHKLSGNGLRLIYNIASGKLNVYENTSIDSRWKAVKGYYGLAKDAYPSLNPLSSGVKAFKTLTNRNITGDWYSICWSPKLGIFVAISASASNNLMTSNNGVNWNVISIPQRTWGTTWGTQATLVWSPELEMFVGISSTSTNNIMYSYDGINWSYVTTAFPQFVRTLCWSPELGIFIVCNNTTTIIYSSKNGITWNSVSPTFTPFQSNLQNQIITLCWADKLGLFVGVGNYGTYRMLISKNGTNWNLLDVGLTHSLMSVCWSKQLGLLVAVGAGNTHRVLISNNGTHWTYIEGISYALTTVVWCDTLALFVAGTNGNIILTSPNGINWSVNNTTGNFRSSCWSSELGLYVALGSNILVTSSLKGRPPTSYNVFDSSFNRIDENGKWDFSNINVTTLTANGASVSSDDRLKHNEVVINNGLDIIDKLAPKFYQKTQVLLDANYNGDLSGYAWNYEAGLIAQELLQISDLSFTVGGGDYYEQTYNLIKQTNDLSNSYYGLSNANYDLSNTNYEVSNSYYGLSNANYDLSNSYYDLNNSYYDLSNSYYDLSNSYYGLSNANYDLSNTNYEVSNNLIAQPYNVNYNSVFVYGLAAIKELHAKVKAQEATLLNQKNIVTSLLTKIATLENNRTN